MNIKKTNIKIRNIKIRKNWNKFSFKKLGAIFCLFLFGVVTFVSGNLAQVNAASSSTVLPVAKGGTGANSASGARTNLNAQETLVSGTNIRTVFGKSLLGSGDVTNSNKNLTTLLPGQSTAIATGYGIFTINDNLSINMENWTDRETKWGISVKAESWNTSRCLRASASNGTAVFAGTSGKEQFIPAGNTNSILLCTIAATGSANYFVSMTFDGNQGMLGQVFRLF